MPLTESPTGTAVLLGILSAVSIHAYFVLRRLQVSVDIQDSSPISRTRATAVWTSTKLQAHRISSINSWGCSATYSFPEPGHHLAMG